MLTTTDIVIFSIGFILFLVFMVFYFMGLKYAAMFDVLDEKDFPLKEVYFVGYAILELIGYSYKSQKDRNLRKELEALYEKKYSDYYIRVVHSQKITIAFLVCLLGFPMYGFSRSIVTLGMFVVMAATMFYYFGTATHEKINKRSEQMLNDFSNVVSKLALLTNAGMIMREAWREVAYTGETAIYQEMQRAVVDMDNGVSEIDALFNFGNRCIIPDIKKFTSTIIQGIVKGNSELVIMLQEQSKEVWNLKKQNIRRQGEKAASKLLIPIMIMFVGILIMIIIPIFTNLGV